MRFFSLSCGWEVLHLEGEGHLAQAVLEVGGEGTIVVLKLKKSLNVGLLFRGKWIWIYKGTYGWSFRYVGISRWESPKNA